MNAQLAPVMREEIEAYSATERGLAELRSRLAGRVYDVTTGKGLDEAKKDRAECRSLRVDLEAKRKEIKAPALDYCRHIDSEAKRITAEIEAMEDPIDQQIKAEEARKEAARAERERAELARLAAITQRIGDLSAAPVKFLGVRPEAITEEIARLEADDLGDIDDTHKPNAEAARDAAVATLRRMLEESQRIAKEREELEAARQAQAAAEAEARAIREREDAERRAAQEAEDRRREEAAAAERAEQERRAAELAQQQRELEEREARIRAEQEAAERERRAEAEHAERMRLEAEEAQRIEREEAALREATLASAAQGALTLLIAEGYADRFETRALQSALSREVTP